jgi:hypothetical protein
VVVVNFASQPAAVAVDGEGASGWMVEVASPGTGEGVGEGERFGGAVPGDAGLVLRPIEDQAAGR